MLGLALGASFTFYFLSPYCLALIFTAILFLFCAHRKGKRTFLVFLSAFLLSSLILLALSFPNEGTGEYLGIVTDSRDNYFILSTLKGRYYVYGYAHEQEVGDILKIYGRAEEYVATRYEGRFYFPEYLSSKGVDNRLYVYKQEDLFLFPIRMRKWQLSFLSSFSSLTRGLIDSLLFDRKDYDNDLIALSSSIGSLYFLSSSGLIFQAFLSLFNRLLFLKMDRGKANKWTFLFALSLLPFFYRKIGVWRVILTRGIALIVEMKGYERPLRVDIVAFSGIILFFIDPFIVIQESFLIGYGLSLLLPLSSGVLGRYEGRKKKIVTSIFVIFFLFPIFIEGNAFHFFAPIYSFLFKPLTLPFVFLSFFSFIINLPFVSLLEGYSAFLYSLMSFFSSFDFVVPFGNFTGFVIYFYYLIFVMVIFFVALGFPYPAHLLNKGLLFINLLRLFPLSNLFTSSVTFLNVGQGDSILIRDGTNAVLIDTGGNISFDMASEVLIPYFRGQGIYHLDALITTHDDYDHSGAANSLIANFWVDEWLDEASDFPYAKGNIHLENLNTYFTEESEENAQSLVLYGEFIGQKWLFMGDATTEIEEKIIADNPHLDCDILKIGHHGSNTSSSVAFLDQVTPKEAIISCGKKNNYGHPHEEIIERLEERGITIRRTDEEGSIEYCSFRSFFS